MVIKNYWLFRQTEPHSYNDYMTFKAITSKLKLKERSVWNSFKCELLGVNTERKQKIEKSTCRVEERLFGTPEYDLKPSCCRSWRTGVKEIYLSLQYYTRVEVYAKKAQKCRSATSCTYTRNNQKCASSFSFPLQIIIQNKPTGLTARRKKKIVSFFLSN